jgi:hypothetical protein
VNYPAVETADTNVSNTLYNDAYPNITLTFKALSVGTAGNSINIWSGNSTYGVCSAAGVKSYTNCQSVNTGKVGASTVGSTSAPLTGGTVSTAASGTALFLDFHTDVSQWDNTVAAATTTSGSIASNVFTAPTGSTWAVGQYLFGANITSTTQIASGVVSGSCAGGCTVTGQANAASSTISGTFAPLRPGGTDAYNIAVRNSSLPNSNSAQFEFVQQAICCVTNISFHHNISNLIDNNSAYWQNVNNPTTQYNTLLNDVESNAWDPSDSSYDSISNPVWSTVVNRADIISVAPVGGGGGTFVNNLSNYYGGSFQTTSSQPAPWNLSSGTLTQTNNENVGSGLGLGQWAYPHLFSPSGLPTDGTTVFASYALMFPNLPSGYQTALTNRAATIAAFTPAVGATFTATTTSGSYCVTVNSGSTPAQYTPINGPGFAAGAVVEGVGLSPCSAGQLTMNITASANETAQTFATLSLNPDGSYNGALTPADSTGAACWNNGLTNFNPSETCAAQGLIPATQDVPTALGLIFNNPANSGLIPATGGF